MTGGSPFAFATLSTSILHWMAVYALCSMRIMTTFVVFPPMSSDVVKGAVRNGIVMLFGGFVAYGQSATLLDFGASMLVVIALKEALIGGVLGFLASTVFWVAENLGLIIDDLSGYNNVQVNNPQRSDSSTPTSSLLTQLVIACFWVLGGMISLLGAIYESFTWLPVADFTPVPGKVLEAFVLHQTDTLMQTSVKVATPIVVILVLIDLAFGFVAKGAEKLEPMELSQPVKGAITVLVLAVFVGVFVDNVRADLALVHFEAQLRGLFHAPALGTH